jgi:S1-C subfamily serine protease
MGDIITKVNNHTVRNPNDLSRIIMSSTKNIVFEVEDQNKNKRLITV